MTYGRAKHAARCVATYHRIIPGSELIDQNGKTLCAVPATSIRYDAGDLTTFSTRAALDNFLKANPQAWERATP